MLGEVAIEFIAEVVCGYELAGVVIAALSL